MWVRVLGSAAGGGFPQWNCSCPQCRAARTGSRHCLPRTQSSIAVSADKQEWFLINASPDTQSHIGSLPGLHTGDGSALRPRAVLLTDAELDHTVGLLLLREGRGLEVHATASMYQTLTTGTGLLRTLESYCPVQWVPVVPGSDVALGQSLSYSAFDVPTTKRMRFAGAAAEGRVVGYRVTDTTTGRSLVYLPCVQELTSDILGELSGSAVLLVDGTFWRDDEMPSLGLSTRTSRDMGHVPIHGPGGSLGLLAPLSVDRKIYIHINNTNPILLHDSMERRCLDRHGMEVAVDGMELEI
ncbi:pyrroloquinoline quinone biosynthesis protein PqqB [Arthrobacter sp. 18067]|uniref:pyrroloquinoline quinone biosynthesis protein PqqB n=1 Tax=Arthrobacter sp. 18067 TaxID=2681413 RepID=UPI001359127B|nr:pyrroloquinoline quinone biosynthesis protein PqqB [Arthrobacter sp. 18067]